MFYSKNYFTRFIYFFFYAFSDAEKFRENSYLQKQFFNVIFKRLLFHQFFKVLSVKHIISLSFEPLKNKKCTSYALFTEKCTFGECIFNIV